MTGIPNFRVDDASQAQEIERFSFVRSYDFEFSGDSYVVGRVQHTDLSLGGCYCYEIAVLKHVVAGEVIEPVSRTRVVFPPRNGTPHSFGGYCNGVRKLEGEELEYWTERWADWASDVDMGGE